MYYPHIIETTGRSSKAFDLPTKLLQDRIIYLGAGVDSDVANYVAMQLLWLNAESPDEPIQLYINSPGGSVYDGLAIKDVMHNISAPVNTVGIGICMSMGAYLLAAGTGERRVMENCRIMVHSVSSGTYGNFHDMKIDFEETKFLQDRLVKDLSDFTRGKTSEAKMKKLMERDRYMSAEQAIDCGLVDSIV
jgi:ATP-dependent Clp protease protease subunit